MAANIPLGFRFKPSDEEVIQFIHLLSEGKELDEIIWADLYSTEEPWDLFKIYGKERNKVVYFATILKRKTEKGNRIRRTVGVTGGSWTGQNKATAIKLDSSSALNNRNGGSTIIGWKKNLRYQNKSNPAQSGEWLMKEYNLNQDSKPLDVVICRIKNKKIDVEEDDVPNTGFADDILMLPQEQQQNQSTMLATINANYNHAEAEAEANYNNNNHIPLHNYLPAILVDRHHQQDYSNQVPSAIWDHNHGGGALEARAMGFYNNDEQLNSVGGTLTENLCCNSNVFMVPDEQQHHQNWYDDYELMIDLGDLGEFEQSEGEQKTDNITTTSVPDHSYTQIDTTPELFAFTS